MQDFFGEMLLSIIELFNTRGGCFYKLTELPAFHSGCIRGFLSLKRKQKKIKNYIFYFVFKYYKYDVSIQSYWCPYRNNFWLVLGKCINIPEETKHNKVRDFSEYIFKLNIPNLRD